MLRRKDRKEHVVFSLNTSNIVQGGGTRFSVKIDILFQRSFYSQKFTFFAAERILFDLQRLFTIFILAVLLWKTGEPLLITLRYTEALQTPLPKMENESEQITIKVHASLPYTGNFEEADPVQKCFKVGDEFYNVVERRYENDTLYFTLQRNVNARDRFDALSMIMTDLSSDSQTHKQPASHHNTPSAKDFLTVFSPSVSPEVVVHALPGQTQQHTSVWHYNFFVPTNWASITSPPPDGV